jgi:hypothetical protein
MNILFIENREKTAFWEQVALNLRQRGHRIAWMVQNPQFAPPAFSDTTDVHRLPFPVDAAGPATTQATSENWVREHHPELITDRGRSHFGAGTAHYGHYTAAIESVLRLVAPDLVVGESTLFHELIAIDRCRRAGILYVHPCANRYPSGRFSLFAYDTQQPAAGSGEAWPETNVDELAERIGSGHEVPFYMRRSGRAQKLRRRLLWAATRGRVWWGRLLGERYNTPSLRRKLALARQVQARLARWATLQRLPADPARTLMYPLQLQPEANIDVWGRPYSDQVALVREMLAAAPANVQIAVKANPKAKYELADELLALAASEPRLCLLPLGMSMQQAHAQCVGAVTVSGTVAFEAIFGKGRCVSLRHPLIEQEFPAFHAASPTDAVRRLLDEPHSGRGSLAVGTRLLERLIAQSFPGLVSDPLSHPGCLASGNVDAVARAIDGLVAQRAASPAEPLRAPQTA